MRKLWILAAPAVALCIAAGCTPEGVRKVDVMSADEGFSDGALESSDIIRMSSLMAPSILRCDDVMSRTPENRAVIVIDQIENKTSQRDLRVSDVSLRRMRVELNKHAGDRVIFVVRRFAQRRLAKERTDARDDYDYYPIPGLSESKRRKPDYALAGVFYDHKEKKGTYHLCTFQLINLVTGDIVWEDKYEVKRAAKR